MMKQKSNPTTGNLLHAIALASCVMTLGGCRLCAPRQDFRDITPAARNSIIINAGYRETNWTTLDPCQAWESPVQYEQVDEDWYLYQNIESMPYVIEQVKHEVPSEFAEIELTSLEQGDDNEAVHLELADGAFAAVAEEYDDTAHESASSTSAEPGCSDSKGDEFETGYESTAGESQELESVNIEDLR